MVVIKARGYRAMRGQQQIQINTQAKRHYISA